MSKFNSSSNSKSKILVMLTGSIACYKVAHVLSRLTQNHCDVKVVASKSALEFIGTSTLEGLTGNTVTTEMYASGHVMEHIHLMRWADLILVAPATANFINKAAHGIGDDFIHTLFLAHDFKRPLLIAPAMNVAMYDHPLTQESFKKLKSLGLDVLDSHEGHLACGETGKGRLLDPDQIVESVLVKLREAAVESTASLKKFDKSSAKKILITSGGTQEPIDTVRVISNLSSGRTGKELAEMLVGLGFNVTLLRSHSSPAAEGVHEQSVFTSFQSLESQLKEKLQTGDYSHVIHLAAVSDYSLDKIEINGEFFAPLALPKLSSEAEKMSLHLKKNPKLVDQLKSWSPSPLKVVAFKLTSQASSEERQKAIKKLSDSSHAEWIVHNDLSEIDIVQKTHRFTIFTKDSQKVCDNVQALGAYLATQIFEGVHS